MKITRLELPDLAMIEPEPVRDARGFFGRLFDEALLEEAGLCARYPQWSVSHNTRAGTLRGLHWQADPNGEVKLVRCTRGAIFDVAVDIRKDSPTFGRYIALELTAENHRAFYIPRGFAHGFQTLTDDAEVLYHISEPYRPDAARGAVWNDPGVGIAWPPCAERIISERDAALPRLPI